MCYKAEVQKKNKEKLQEIFQRDGAPEFIQRLSKTFGKSKATAITYWGAIRDLLQYMIDTEVIHKKNISDIEPEDMLEIEAPEIQGYLEYKEINGMSPTTLEVRRNIFNVFWKKMIGTIKIPVEVNVLDDVSYRGISCDPNNILFKMPLQENIGEMIERIKWKKDEFVRERNLAVMNLLMGTGIREIGLAGLDLQDVYLDEETPYIKVLDKGERREQSKRIVFLSEDETVESIKHWLEIRSKVEIHIVFDQQVE